jgi:hypothetical protein
VDWSYDPDTGGPRTDVYGRLVNDFDGKPLLGKTIIAICPINERTFYVGNHKVEVNQWGWPLQRYVLRGDREVVCDSEGRLMNGSVDYIDRAGEAIIDDIYGGS